MAQKIGSLIAQLGMDTARFDAGIKNAGSKITRFKKKSVAAFKRINQSVSGLAGKLAGLIGIGAFIATTKAALDTADVMQKLNLRIGISTEALSELKFAGEQAGIEFSTLTKAIEKMSNSVGEAATGTGEAQLALLELGLSAEKLKDLKPEQQLEVMADAFNGVTNATDRTRLAMDIFGARGASMLQLMDGGAGTIRALRDEASRLGLTLDHETAVGAANANDAINRVKSTFNAMALETAANLAPAIETIANGLSQNLPKASQIAVNAFMSVRKHGLQMLSFVVQGIGKFQFFMAEAFEKMGMANSNLMASAAFSAEFAKNLLLSADEAAKVLTGDVTNLNIEIKNISPVGIESVASAYGKLTAEQAKAALAGERANKKIAKSIRIDIGDTANNVFGQVQDHFKNMIRQMLNDWISSGITKIFGGGGGTGGISGFLGGLFGGARLGGGSVRAGTSYLVGESGPELFTPGRSGNITSNKNIRGGVTIIQHNDFSGRGGMDIAQTQQMISINNELLKGEIFELLKRELV